MLTMRDPGIEPGSVPWQGTILPLNQPRFILKDPLKSPYQIPVRGTDNQFINVYGDVKSA